MKREARFSVGQRAKIVRLLDNTTTKELIGREGVVTEVDPLPNGDFNYYLSCSRDDIYYMHEEELKA